MSCKKSAKAVLRNKSAWAKLNLHKFPVTRFEETSETVQIFCEFARKVSVNCLKSWQICLGATWLLAEGKKLREVRLKQICEECYKIVAKDEFSNFIQPKCKEKSQ